MLRDIYSPRQGIREAPGKKMRSVIGGSDQGEAPRATPIPAPDYTYTSDWCSRASHYHIN